MKAIRKIHVSIKNWLLFLCPKEGGLTFAFLRQNYLHFVANASMSYGYFSRLRNRMTQKLFGCILSKHLLTDDIKKMNEFSK